MDHHHQVLRTLREDEARRADTWEQERGAKAGVLEALHDMQSSAEQQAAIRAREVADVMQQAQRAQTEQRLLEAQLQVGFRRECVGLREPLSCFRCSTSRPLELGHHSTERRDGQGSWASRRNGARPSLNSFRVALA